MASLTINIPDALFEDLNTIAKELKQTPEQSLMLALCHFLQNRTLDVALEGIARTDMPVEFIDFPELKEAYDLEIKFHPMAIEELEALEEEDQMAIMEELIDRISTDPEEMTTDEEELDLVLTEGENHQIVLSEFDFGDVVYKIDDAITVYHIALVDEMFEEDEEEEDEDLEEEVSTTEKSLQ